jgi:drug/metabolite transporter (DMT)-like permease
LHCHCELLSIIDRIIASLRAGWGGYHFATVTVRALPATSAVTASTVAQLLVLSLFWGSAYLFTRAAVPAFGPVALVALRFAIAACLLLPVVALMGEWRTMRQRWPQLLLLGVVFTIVPFVVIAFAARTLGAGTLAILNATAPLFGALVARAWSGEPISAGRLAGLVVGFVGVAILVSGDGASDCSPPTSAGCVRPDGGLPITGASGETLGAISLMLGVSLLWAVGAHFARTRMADVDPVTVAAGNSVVTAVLLAPVALAFWPGAAPSMRAWIEVLLLGILSSAAGMLLYFRLLRRIGTVPTMSVTFLSPVVAVVSGAFYLGEVITARTVVGGAIVLAGTALVLGLRPRGTAGRRH